MVVNTLFPVLGVKAAGAGTQGQSQLFSKLQATLDYIKFYLKMPKGEKERPFSLPFLNPELRACQDCQYSDVHRQKCNSSEDKSV